MDVCCPTFRVYAQLSQLTAAAQPPWAKLLGKQVARPYYFCAHLPTPNHTNLTAYWDIFLGQGFVMNVLHCWSNEESSPTVPLTGCALDFRLSSLKKKGVGWGGDEDPSFFVPFRGGCGFVKSYRTKRFKSDRNFTYPRIFFFFFLPVLESDQSYWHIPRLCSWWGDPWHSDALSERRNKDGTCWHFRRLRALADGAQRSGQSTSVGGNSHSHFPKPEETTQKIIAQTNTSNITKLLIRHCLLKMQRCALLFVITLEPKKH